MPIFPYTLGKTIVFFLLPEAFCGLKCAENVIAAEFLLAILRLPLLPMVGGNAFPAV